MSADLILSTTSGWCAIGEIYTNRNTERMM
jgi:hypothetical protein